MFERYRLIISMILLINLGVIFWRLSWQNSHIAATLESRPLYNNETTYVFSEQQQRVMSMLDNVWAEGNVSGILPYDFSNLPNDIFPATTQANGPSRTDDPRRLIDLWDFEYKLKQAACSRRIQALIMVHSAPRNFKKRKLIRETWANRRQLRLTPLRVLFLFGTVQDEDLQRQLVRENEKYADIVQGNFVDDYRNMTYKHIMALKWFLHKCAHAQLLIKVDDDIFVNTPQLLKYARKEKFVSDQSREEWLLKTTSPAARVILELFNRPRGLLFCDKNPKAMVKRTYRSKWRVSFQEYALHYYPPYCPGYAIVYSADVVASLYASAQQHKFFWIDDVFVTGILAQFSGIEIINFSDYVLTDNMRADLLQNKVNFADLEFLFTTHGISAEQMRTLWAHFGINDSNLDASQDTNWPPSSLKSNDKLSTENPQRNSAGGTIIARKAKGQSPFVFVDSQDTQGVPR